MHPCAFAFVGGCRIDFTQFNDLLPLQRNGR
eukprot:COSAG06_NODE_54407_length_294_cov_1.656410_1_plen_30_part_01